MRRIEEVWGTHALCNINTDACAFEACVRGVAEILAGVESALDSLEDLNGDAALPDIYFKAKVELAAARMALIGAVNAVSPVAAISSLSDRMLDYLEKEGRK